jgi:hypothetical protein
MKRVGFLSFLVAAVALAVGVGASAQTGGLGPPPFPDAMNAGCQRSNTGLVTDTSPSWVYVNRDSTPKFASGIVSKAHLSRDDLNVNHESYDFNSDVTVDPPYTNLLGGDPTRRTGNFQPAGDETEQTGKLHVERESKFFPFFAWPHDGDRVAMWGSWIWDCAHWSPGAVSGPRDPGQPGEKTEIHPIRAIVVTRKDGYLANRGQVQADVYVSSYGTFARAEENCALMHAPVDQDHYDAGFQACKNNPANRRDPLNDTDYTFFIPAPSKKPAGSKLQYRVIQQVKDDAPPIRVQIQSSPPGIQVTLPFKSANKPDGSFARTFLVGWSKPPSHPPAHFKVEIVSYKLLKALDPNPANRPLETSKAPDEDVVTLDVNGHWQLLEKLAPKLLKIRKGQTVKVGRSFDLYASRGLSVNVNGYDCDVNTALPPCPPLSGETDLLNDNLGQKIAHFSQRRAAGRHVLKSPDGVYALTLDVKRLRR